jgi:DNA-binding transcriptional LysR family regulator
MNDRFEAMQAFIAVCDCRGFAAASRKLDLAPSIVSRLVAGLETHLGVRLLQRTTRSISLTDAGTRFLERARRIVAEVEEAELSAQEERGEPTGRLVVGASTLFGPMHLTPIISRYMALYPKVSVELLLTNQFVNLVEDGIDVAVRLGALADSGLIARALGQTRRILVATPSYLAAQGTPLQPADLSGHRLIAFSGATSRRDWPFWTGGVESIVTVEPHFYCNSGDAAIMHALNDGGIVSVLAYQVEEARRAGRLVEVLREFAPAPVPIQAVFPTSCLLSHKVRAFIDLVEQSKQAWQLTD